MHLSQKQKYVSQLFCAFLKSALNFEHSSKKMTFIGYIFPNLKAWLEKCLKYLVLDDH